MPPIPLIAMPEGIAITDPSDIVITSPKAVESDLVGAATGRSVEGSVFHSMVTAGRDGVAIGIILGVEVMLER